MQKLSDHISFVVLDTARCLQSWAEPRNRVYSSPMQTKMDSDPCSEFADALIKCTVDLPVPMVNFLASVWHITIYDIGKIGYVEYKYCVFACRSRLSLEQKLNFRKSQLIALNLKEYLAYLQVSNTK